MKNYEAISRNGPLVEGLAAVSAILLLSACDILILQKAEMAYVREDWDTAIEWYQKAADEAEDVSEIQEIKDRIRSAKKEASASSGQEAKNRLETKEYALAYEAARRAYGYDPRAENTALLAEIKREYARFLHYQGKAQLDSGFLDEALKSIEHAHELDPNPEFTNLLQDLRARMRQRGKGNFAKMISTANEFFDRRSWNDAVVAYSDALRIQDDPLARDKQAFALLLIEAEETKSTNPSEASQLLEKARSLGYHRTYVKALLEGLR